MAIDTALQRCSVAIVQNKQLLAKQQLNLEKGHAEHLAPLVAQTLRQAKVKIADLNSVGVVIGPGGFTGVRVGLAFSRGLALGTNIELFGMTSLAALVVSFDEQNDKNYTPLLAPIIDARRDEVYCSLYEPPDKVSNELTPILDPFAALPKTLPSQILAKSGERPVILFGTGAHLLANNNYPNHWQVLDHPNQIDIEAMALQITKMSVNETRSTLVKPPIAPLYLRAPDAKPSAKSLFAQLANPTL